MEYTQENKENKENKEKKTGLQDMFLNSLRKEKVLAQIYLSNGICLRGKITSFDGYTILLVDNGNAQLIYKHHVSTILPSKPLAFTFARTDEAETN